MFCGQIRALYFGDYETGLDLELQALRYWENITGRMFPLLRIAQIQIAQDRYAEAFSTLELARPLEEKVVYDVGRAGLALVTVMYYYAVGGRDNLHLALGLTSQIQKMVSDNLVSRQYQMAAACEASAIHLRLAKSLRESKTKDAERQTHLTQALEASQLALSIYEQFGFVQIVECFSEEIFYRHSQACAANDRESEATEFLERAYQEMMRKHDLIPPETPFRRTFLENIKLHLDIHLAYAAENPRAVPPLAAPPSSQQSTP
jgi:hypothetical protein